MNNSVMKCCICNNEKCGEFITINNKKYHLCCIEQLQNNWNELKDELKLNLPFKVVGVNRMLRKMQEIESRK